MADQNMDDSSQNDQPIEENVSKPDGSEKESTQVIMFIYLKFITLYNSYIAYFIIFLGHKWSWRRKRISRW